MGSAPPFYVYANYKIERKNITYTNNARTTSACPDDAAICSAVAPSSILPLDKKSETLELLS